MYSYRKSSLLNLLGVNNVTCSTNVILGTIRRASHAQPGAYSVLMDCLRLMMRASREKKRSRYNKNKNIILLNDCK